MQTHKANEFTSCTTKEVLRKYVNVDVLAVQAMSRHSWDTHPPTKAA